MCSENSLGDIFHKSLNSNPFLLMKTLLTFLFAMVAFAAYAQPKPVLPTTSRPDTTARQLAECGTPSLSPEQAEKMLNSIRELEPKLKKMRTEATQFVAIQFHMVKTPMDKGVDQPFIYELLKALNIAFQSSEIQFSQYGGYGNINYIEYSERFFNFNSKSEEDLCKDRDVRNAINLYLVNEIIVDVNNSPGKSVGYVNRPDSKPHPENRSYSLSDRGLNRVFIALSLEKENGEYKHNPVTKKEVWEKTIPHEVGHFFGLSHTFEDEYGKDYGNDCTNKGDFICDTPPTEKMLCRFYNSSECYASTVWKPYDGVNTQYSYPYNNMMSYFYGCGQVFTFQQRERMRTWGYYLRTRLSDSLDTRYYIDGNNHIGYKLPSQSACAGQKVRFQLVQFGVWKWQDLQRLQMEISGPGVPRQLLPLTIIDDKTAEGTIPITAGSGQHDIRVTDRFSQTADFEPITKITINAQPPTPTIALTPQGLQSSAAVGNQWYVNGTALPGQTSPLLSATQPGAVTVSVSVGGCTSVASQPFAITATEPLPRDSQLVAFPNPASQSIQIKGLMPGSVRVSAVDLSGRVLSESSYDHHQGTVSFPVKESFGKVFLLKVENEDRVWSQRIAVSDL